MRFLALFRKELAAYFVSPLFYVVGAVFLALTGFFFYTQLIYFVQYGFGINIIGNFWFAFLAGAPYSVSTVLLLVCPLLTMRLLAEEKKLGTIEFLLTHPIRDGTLLAAKLGAAVSVLMILLAATLLYPLFLGSVHPLPWAPLFSGYVGLLLLGVSFLCCGLFVSSLTDSQVIAAVGTLGLLLFLWALTWNEAAASPLVLRIGKQLSMFDHFETFARGVVDAGDLVYFLGVSVFFVFLTLRVLESRHWRGQR